MKEYRSQKAVDYFKKGYNCSQSITAAFCNNFGLDEKTALGISQGFGGGIGRMREVCGAFSGAVILAGLKNPCSSNKEVYEIVQKLAGEFKKENGSLICHELLGLKKNEDNQPTPSERSDIYYKKRPCVKIVENTAKIVERILLNENS